MQLLLLVKKYFTPSSSKRLDKKEVARKIIESKKANQPITIYDLDRVTNLSDKQQYRKAIDSEFQPMEECKVLRTVPRTSVPQDAEIGTIMVMLTKKRDGRYKSRVVFNGRRQKCKLSAHYSFPTLRHEALHIALTLSYDFASGDISTAFFNADLPVGVKLYAQIHPDTRSMSLETRKSLKWKRTTTDLNKLHCSGGSILMQL